MESNFARGTDFNKDITIEYIVEHYLEKAKYTMKERSYLVEKQCVEKVIEYFHLKGLIYFRLLTPKSLQDFIVWRKETITPRGKPPSNVTVNKNIAAIKRALNLASKNQLIPQDPFANVSLIRVDKEDSPRIFSKEDIRIIEQMAEKSTIKSEIFFLVRTGLRVSEMVNLEIADVDLGKNIIIVRSVKAKSRKTRYVPIVKGLGIKLQELLNEAKANQRSLVFVNSQGNKHCLRNILRRFRTILKNAKKYGVDIEGVNIHSLRKTYISHMIMSGQDPVKVMKIVGHQSWETMKKYLFLTEEYLQDVPSLF
ncbi:tyrosine-type recombinase/integrase [Candidatus Uabimicrobium amorphum]|uniref:tyrosine-type recombinase/integrase n=1 Tax=Uabimicrobium amorphum TaxID=2596890 RepID=UPI00125F1461|nr:site-specific integrase [Candidatus Uabimicrobium amorphum]